MEIVKNIIFIITSLIAVFNVWKLYKEGNRSFLLIASLLIAANTIYISSLGVVSVLLGIPIWFFIVRLVKINETLDIQKLTRRDIGIGALGLVVSVLAIGFINGTLFTGFTIFYIDAAFYAQIANLIPLNGLESSYAEQEAISFGESASPINYHYMDIWLTHHLAKLFNTTYAVAHVNILHPVLLFLCIYLTWLLFDKERRLSVFFLVMLVLLIAPISFWITFSELTKLKLEDNTRWLQPFGLSLTRGIGGIKHCLIYLVLLIPVRSFLNKKNELVIYSLTFAPFISFSLLPISAILVFYICIISGLSLIKRIVIPTVVLFVITLVSNLYPKILYPAKTSDIVFDFTFSNLTHVFSKLGLLFSFIFSQNQVVFAMLLLGFIFLGFWKKRYPYIIVSLVLLIVISFPLSYHFNSLLPLAGIPLFYCVFKLLGDLNEQGALLKRVIFVVVLTSLPHLLFPKFLNLDQIFTHPFISIMLMSLVFLGIEVVNSSTQQKYYFASLILLVLISLKGASDYQKTKFLSDSQEVTDFYTSNSNLFSDNLMVKSGYFVPFDGHFQLHSKQLGTEILFHTNNWVSTNLSILNLTTQETDNVKNGPGNKFYVLFPIIQYKTRNPHLTREELLTNFVKEKGIKLIYRHKDYSYSKLEFLVRDADSVQIPSNTLPHVIYTLK